MGLKFEANLPMDAEMCSLLYSKSPIAHVSKVGKLHQVSMRLSSPYSFKGKDADAISFGSQ